jgi:hypothetical protein
MEKNEKKENVKKKNRKLFAEYSNFDTRQICWVLFLALDIDATSVIRSEGKH